MTERPQPEFDPVPVRLGAFEARPELAAGVGYTSNLFASSQNETSDTYLRVNPKVDVTSLWSRHQLSASLEADARAYSDTSDESATDLAARVSGQLDASSAFDLVGAVVVEELNEPRSAAASVPNAAEPVEYQRVGAEVGANYEVSRVRLRGRLSVDQFDFEDVPLNGGGTRDQDYRDRDETTGSVRASWAQTRDYAVFVEGVLVEREYDQNTPGALNRDSSGQIARVGVNFELPVLIRGDVAVGYQTFDYDDPAFSDVDGLSVEANAQWFVTQLTTLSGNATRRVIDPGLQNSAGASLTSISGRVDHELRRNWIVGGGLEFSNFDFEGLNREDDRVIVTVDTNYKLNRNVWLNLSAQHIDQDSTARSFTDDRISVGLRLFP